MNKWAYINLISKRGDQYGNNGGVYDLLVWSGKVGTVDVTDSEAKAFWERWPNRLPVLPLDTDNLHNAPCCGKCVDLPTIPA